LPARPEDGARPRVCFVGPMVGRHAGRLVSQEETLATLFAEAGYQVVRTSAVRQPVVRAAGLAADLLRHVTEFDVAVVAVFSGRNFAYADLSSLMARRLGKAVVLHLHGGALPELAARHPRWVERVARRAHAVVAPSTYLAERFAGWPCPPVVIPNALAVDELPYQRRERVVPRLLWMRAFEELYRPSLALRVLARITARAPEATLTMAGPDGGLLAGVRAEAERLGLATRVSFPGLLTGTSKDRALASHDVLLSTSRVDNAPVSVLEAAAWGLPVVAASVGGLPHLLTDGEDGLLVEAGDGDGAAEPLADAVLRLLAEPGLAARLSANGAALAHRSRWPQVRPQWEELLEVAIARARGAVPSGPARSGRTTAAGLPARAGAGDGDRRLALRVGPIGADHLGEVARVHCSAFPQGQLTALGLGVVRRYYAWQLEGPHASVALGAFDSERLVGFCLGGTFSGAFSGFVHANWPLLARAVLARPGMLLRASVRDRSRRAALALARTGNRPAGVDGRSGPAPVAAARPSYGILVVAVEPRYRRQQVGRALLEASEEAAAARGFRQMHLTVDPANVEAARFYEACGWEREGTDGTWARSLQCS